jgi:hypothetical protein
MATLSEWLAGTTADGKPLPIAKVNAYRQRHGLPIRSRGLGDTIAKITHATGIDRVVKAVTGSDCGCAKRQQWLNEVVPYKHG